MPIDPLDLTRQLIAIPCPSGAEGEVGRYLVPVLEGLGLTVTVQPVASGRFNLLATTGNDPEVVLCTHIDVVPPHIPPSEDETYIYGRGACDTKGVLAAMLAAAERLLKDDVKRFGMLLVVGEETDSAGARTANERSEWPTRFVVVGEPTESRFVAGQKGAFKARLTVRGKAAHSAYPEKGESALLKMLPLLHDLEAADWGEDSLLGPGTMNIGVLNAGLKPNIIPGEATAGIMVRVVDSIAETQTRLERLVGGRAEIVIDHSNEPQEIYVPEGRERTVIAFNTDIPFLPKLGRPLLYGPGSITDAHGEGEKIAKKDLLAAIDVYDGLVRELLASGD